jgi:hypothetical protein
VVAYLKDARGSHLDATLVDLLLQNLDAALAINARYPS